MLSVLPGLRVTRMATHTEPSEQRLWRNKHCKKS